MAERMTDEQFQRAKHWASDGRPGVLINETERARDREDALTQANILLEASLTRADREKEALRAQLAASLAQDKQAEANFARLEAEKERHRLRAVALAEALSNLLPLVRDSVPEKKAAVALLAKE